MAVNEGDFKKRAKKYLTFETDIEEPTLQSTQKMSSVYGDDVILSVKNKASTGSWWLIGGSTPITLIRRDLMSVEKAYAFHIGITSRLIRQQQNEDSQSVGDSEYYDVFISHASEDKTEFAAPLRDELSKTGLRVWFDDTEILPGESIYRSIERGLRQCSFGITVFSESYFEKEWTQDELSGLIGRQTAEAIVLVLPVLFNMNISDLRNQAPMLADKRAIDASEKTQLEVAKELFDAIVNHSIDEAKSRLTIDSEIKSTDEDDLPSKSTPDIATEVMISHDIHYFDTRHFTEENISTHRASQIIDGLQEGDDLVRITTQNGDSREDLSDNSLILFNGPVVATPLNNFHQIMTRYDLIGSEIPIEDEDDKLILEQIRSAANYYRAPIPNMNKGHFVFELSGAHMKHDVQDFTGEYPDHSVIGKIKHVYRKGQRDDFLEMVNDMPIRNRRERTERRRLLKGLASRLDAFGNDVSDSDFYIAHPDVTITPVAVYD